MKDYFGYNGKTVVVTGAASGMGKAAAEMLVDLGAKVYALDWAEVKVEGIEKYIHTDLSQKASIDAAFEIIPEKVDSFFGIAGVSGTMHDSPTVVKINLISNKYICEEILVSRMTKGGTIALMSSTGGKGGEKEDNKKHYLPVVQADGWDGAVEALERTVFAKMPGAVGYPFSKLALNYLTMHLLAKFGPMGVRVNTVMPGSTESGMTEQFIAMAGSKENMLTRCGYANRFAESSEMAAPIVFLNSDMASYICGEIIVVDYGQNGEEVAGIRDAGAAVSLDGIVQRVMQMAQQKQ